MLGRRQWISATWSTYIDLVAGARPPLAALVRRPRFSTLQRLAGLMPGMIARIDPEEAAAYEEASRDAFRAAVREASPASEALEAPRPRGAGPTATPIAPLIQRPESIPTSEVSRAVPFVPTSKVPIAKRAATTQAGPRAIDDEKAQHESALTKESASDFPVRSSTSVNSVADDFFDGLIRRVEGDR
jgi:hypothetical protein